jgi:abortive infection bacteriophage resistance protein
MQSCMNQRKPAKSLDGMVELLQERGMPIPDTEVMKRILFDNNYYRLSGYFRAFQLDPEHGKNQFSSDANVDRFLIPYKRDFQLRNLILQGTSRLELTIRSRFAYLLAQNGDKYDYENPDLYILSQLKTQKKQDTLKTIKDMINNIDRWIKESKEIFIRHYLRNNADIPIWAAVEVLPFGVVSKMLTFCNRPKIMRTLYKSLDLEATLRTNGAIIHAMVYLRNLCSHHSRLWKREMMITSPLTKKIVNSMPHEWKQCDPKSAARSIAVLLYLVQQITRTDEYTKKVFCLIHENSDYEKGLLYPAHWK